MWEGFVLQLGACQAIIIQSCAMLSFKKHVFQKMNRVMCEGRSSKLVDGSKELIRIRLSSVCVCYHVLVKYTRSFVSTTLQYSRIRFNTSEWVKWKLMLYVRKRIVFLLATILFFFTNKWLSQEGFDQLHCMCDTKGHSSQKIKKTLNR